MKRTLIALAVQRACGSVLLPFVHMRVTTYLGAGGPMLTVKVV